MKRLVIAEKPSVATDLARVLGKVPKKGDFFENDELVITSAVGHVVELQMPEDIDKKRYGFWRLQELPIVPKKFDLKPSEKTKDRFALLKKLMKRKDVTEIINACDAGREGELIFRYVVELAKVKKPTKRLWMVSMTPEGIREAWNNLRTEEDMNPLSDAAHSRSEADWLIGINGTRAITKRMYGRARNVATVGRVQTPTLTLVWEREEEINNFIPKGYWRLVGEFGVHLGTYAGTFQKPNFKKDPENEHDRIDRIWEKAEAERILSVVQSTDTAEVSETKKRTRQSAPRLYDLTTLQREANGRFGFPAGKTLRVAQSLYEKHKMLTYPRTDSRALPEDYANNCYQALRALSGGLENHTKKVIENGWVNPGNKRIFNNKQISDHFAIIPTDAKPKKLNEDEAKIFDMVARRFISVFYPPAEFDVTTRISTVASEHAFKTEGKILAVPGYLEVYGKTVESGDTDSLTPLSNEDGQPPKARIENIDMLEEATKPPPRYTEATLLAAMEGAGKFVEEDELAEAMKEKGLGTPATRASIIDHLAYEKYIEREGRELVPTAKAEDLINFLYAVKAGVLTSPSLTGEWEHKLSQVESGELSRKEFMKGIVKVTEEIVDNTKNFDEKDEDLPKTDMISPSDNLPMLEALRVWKSQDGEISVYKTIGNRRMDIEEIKVLLKEGRIGPLDGFRSKMGKPYSAMLKFEENKVAMDFGDDSDDDGELNMAELEKCPVVGTDPVTGGRVFASPTAYVCEHYRKEGYDNALRINRSLLGKTLPEEDVKKLLSDERKTGLITGFRSNRTKRLFDAFLILKDKNKIGFEFPPRAPKKKAAKKGAKKAAAKKS
ncbi:MAG: DNA topoisomerase III [Opitutales bacterium]